MPTSERAAGRSGSALTLIFPRVEGEAGGLGKVLTRWMPGPLPGTTSGAGQGASPLSWLPAAWSSCSARQSHHEP